MKTPDAEERKTLNTTMMETISFMVLSSQCYHTYIENYFAVTPKQIDGYGDKCSF
jgi:hypothetical protein